MFAWLFGSSDRPPIYLKVRSSEFFIIFTVSSAIFTDVFVYGIVVPVLPFALQSRAGIDPSDSQKWISIFLAVYGAALLVAAPFCGWIADRLESRRWPLLTGLIALAGSTVMLCVGNGIGILVAGRVLQGISAAVVWVVGLALLVDTVGPDNIGAALGYVSLALSLAYLIAPLLGGVVFAQAGYYSVWAMAFGLIGLDVVLRFALVEKKVAKKYVQEECVTETDVETCSSEPYIANAGLDEKEPASPVAIDKDTADNDLPERNASLTPSTAASLATVRMPAATPGFLKRFVSSLPPLFFLLGSRRILSAVFACTMEATLLTAFDALLPLFARDTFHWNSIGAGLLFIPIVIPSFFGPVVGHYADKYGPRWLATAGFVICTPFLILLRLIHKNNTGQKVLLCALLTLNGIGLTLALTPLMAEIAYAADAKARRRPPGFFGKNGAYAQAFSLFNIAFAAGCFLGPLLGGLVNEAHGWGPTTLMLGCISIFTAVPTVIWTGGSIFRLRRDSGQRREGDVEDCER